MKKLLLLALALGTLNAQARQLKFYLGSEPIAEAETVKFTDIEKEDVGTGTEVVMAPELYLFSDIRTTNVNLTATCTSGQSIQMCAGGQCANGTTVAKTGVTIATNEKLPLEFEYLAFIPGDDKAPEVVTDFEAVDPKYPQTRVTFTLVMNPSGSVAGIYIGNDNLRAVHGAIEYDFATAVTLTLADTTGATVLTATLDGRGTLDTSALAQGVYVYRAGTLNGKLYIH